MKTIGQTVETPNGPATNKKQNTMLQARIKETIFYICIVTLPLIQFLIFYVYANLNSFTMSFKTWTESKGWEWSGLFNYKNMWAELITKNTNLNSGMINA